MNRLRLTRSDHDKTVTAAAGDEVTIALDENPTTGYCWAIDNANTDVIEVKSNDYDAAAGNAVGGGGSRRIVLLLKKPGTAHLELNNRREWEGSAAAIDRFAVTFAVKASS